MILDASVLDAGEINEVMREDIKFNRVEYLFPEGLNQVDLFEECRALTMLDDFDTWYDLSMQMLAGRPVTIRITGLDGSKSDLCVFQVVDRHMDLRGIDVINKYPWLVVWMVEFIQGHASKKFPLPGNSLPQPQAAEDREKRAAVKNREEQTAT
jgi:hypothetical protein